jgi:hypothetical protein
MSRLLLAVLVATFLQGGPQERDETAPPVAVFSALDGTWKGTFVGYNEAGTCLYRIRVTQTYRTVSDTEQEVIVRDEMPDGTVITGEGENVARVGDDGRLWLECHVRKSNGEKVKHIGRVVQGPDGDEQIIWFSKEEGRTETFREVVREENGETVYSIDGMGDYGGTLMLMHGRYRKVVK